MPSVGTTGIEGSSSREGDAGSTKLTEDLCLETGGGGGALRYEVEERTRGFGRLSMGIGGDASRVLIVEGFRWIVLSRVRVAERCKVEGFGGGGGRAALGVGGITSSAPSSSSAADPASALCQLSCDPFVDLDASPA